MSPEVDATLTMLPPSTSSRWGRAALDMMKVPVRFTARIRSQVASGMSVVWAKVPMPATLHRTPGRPRAEATPLTVSLTCPSSVTSQR